LHHQDAGLARTGLANAAARVEHEKRAMCVRVRAGVLPWREQGVSPSRKMRTTANKSGAEDKE